MDIADPIWIDVLWMNIRRKEAEIEIEKDFKGQGFTQGCKRTTSQARCGETLEETKDIRYCNTYSR
jgi:hypothetical protein